MTTALPSIYWFAGDQAYDVPAPGMNFSTGTGTPFNTSDIDNVIDPDHYSLYDMFFASIGPIDPENADPDPNLFLEFAMLWFTTGKGNALTTGPHSLKAKYGTLLDAGKTVIHYVGGIHYSGGTTNFAFWDAKLGSRMSRRGRGRIGDEMRSFLRDSVGWLDKRTVVCVDGTGATAAGETARIQTVRILEDEGYTVWVEAYPSPGTYFEGYPSLTFSETAIANLATFNSLPAHNGLWINGEGWEEHIATWRAADRPIFAGRDTVIPGPWVEFGEYGEPMGDPPQPE